MGRDTRTLVAAFVALGAHFSAVSALLPQWAERAGDGVLAAVPALFGGLVAGVLVSAPILADAPPGRVLRGAAVAQAASLVALAAAGRSLVPGTAWLVVALAGVSGVAFGLIETSVSLAARSATGTDRRLGRLFAVSAATAAAVPALVFLAARAGVADAVLALAAVAGVTVALRPAVGRRPAVRPDPAVGSHAVPDERTGNLPAAVPDERPGVPWRVLVPVATALALYVGVETLLAGWSAVLVRDLLAASPSTASLGASAFWVLMSAGRAWGARSAPAGMWPRAVTAAALFAVAAAGVLVGHVPALVLAACAATVLAIAPMYPRLLGLALERLDGRSAARWTGPLVAAGAAGGSLLPALALALGPATGAATFVVAALASLALGAVAPPRRPPRTPAAP